MTDETQIKWLENFEVNFQKIRIEIQNIINNESNPAFTIWKRVYKEKSFLSFRRTFFDEGLVELGLADIKESSANTFMYRSMISDEIARLLTWAIPTDELIQHLSSTTSKIIEVGAGTGYWAKLLNDAGVDVIAYDLNPAFPGSLENDEFPYIKLFYEVLEADAKVAGKYPDRSLLLVWPPYKTSMAFDALIAYGDAGGQDLIYVGEMNGCTADSQFFDLLDEKWVMTERFDIPQKDMVKDAAYRFIKK